MTIKEIKIAIQNFVSKFGTGISKEELVSKVYVFLRGKDIDSSILNDKYIDIGGETIDLIRKRSVGAWLVK